MILKETLYNNLRSNFGTNAIINGNFDIWQRGTSYNPTAGALTYQADHWFDYHAPDGGTLPTLTKLKQEITLRGVPNTLYCSRLTTNGAGTSLGANALGYSNGQRIENGTRYLCGLNKTVTLSYYARSSIANKRLGVFLAQNYGSGGSPTSQEIINGYNDTLTGTWTKYTHTFTTNTLVGKTFGTGNNDFLEVAFMSMWGSSKASLVGASTAESYVGAGDIDVTQVQLSIGSETPLFYPKTYFQELMDCLRYYYRIDGQQDTINGQNQTTTSAWYQLRFPVPMFKLPALETSTITGDNFTNVSSSNLFNISVLSFVNGTLWGGSVSSTCATCTLNAGSFLRIKTSNYIAFNAEI